jgi:hypothetical protein
VTGLAEFGTRGAITRNVNRRTLPVAVAEAAQYRSGIEVVTRVDGGPWVPAGEPSTDDTMAALVALVRRLRPVAHVELVDNRYVAVAVGTRLVYTKDRLPYRASTRWVHLDLPGHPTMRINHDTSPGRTRWTVSAQWGHRPRRDAYLPRPTVDQVAALLAEIEAWQPAVPPVVEPVGQLDLFAGLAGSR